MRPDAEFEAVQELIRAGLNDCAISRATGIPRGTVRDWRHQRNRDQRDSRARERPPGSPHGSNPRDCPICEDGALERDWYAYLLGLYLGDGWISAMPRGVFRLRVVLDMKYPEIINECAEAMARMRTAHRVAPGFVSKIGCIEVASYWKHWPCLFPQHGAGRKHMRPIILDWWQRCIAREHPRMLLRGLIQSDGCRDLNIVKGKSYPRYQFTNESEDVKAIFIDGCDQLGLHWTTPTYKVISIARRADVKALDEFIGPKTSPAPYAEDGGSRHTELRLWPLE